LELPCAISAVSHFGASPRPVHVSPFGPLYLIGAGFVDLLEAAFGALAGLP